MPFTPISAETFIKICTRNNREIDEQELRNRMHNALLQYKNDISCSCGKPIWVAGSCFAETGCFCCLSGKDEPNGDYEIDQAIDKEVCEIPQPVAGHQPSGNASPSLCNECARLNDAATAFICEEARQLYVSDDEFYCHGFTEE